MGIVKSPFRHRDTGTSHDDLPDVDHNKAHGGEKANFKTIEEENDFRNFINQSNPDYAKDFKVDIENKTGKLNNSTIRAAYKQFGAMYQDYSGKIDVFQAGQEKAGSASRRERTRKNPLGIDIYGRNIYKDYEIDENQPIDFKRGYFIKAANNSAYDLQNKINLTIREVLGFDGEEKMIYAESTGLGNIGEYWLGGGEVTIVNKYLGKKLVIDTSEITNIVEEDIRKFINGYDVVLSDKWDGEVVAGDDQPNPLLAFNTMVDGRLITDLDDYNAILFPKYKTEVVIPEADATEKIVLKTNILEKDPIITSKSSVVGDYTKSKFVNGGWYYPVVSANEDGVSEKMIKVEDPIVLRQLEWSQDFERIYNFSKKEGAPNVFDMFFGGHDNHVDAQASMDYFFNLDEEDASKWLNERISSLGYEVEITGGLDGIGQYSTQFITVRETFSADKKEIRINLPWDIAGLTKDGKRNVAKKELVKLFDFLESHFEKVTHANNSTDNHQDPEHWTTYKDIKDKVSLNHKEKAEVETQVSQFFGEKYVVNFVNPDGEHHHHYKSAIQTLKFLGISEDDEGYGSTLMKKAKELLGLELENIKLQLKTKEYYNNVEGTNAEMKTINAIAVEKESLNKEIHQFNAELISKQTQHVNLEAWKTYDPFMKVYNGNGQFTFPTTPLTTETVEGTYKGTHHAGGFGVYEDIRIGEGENLVGDSGFWKYKEDFEQDYSQEVSYYDQVEVEIANGTKLMCPRKYYNDFVLASETINKSWEELEAFEIEHLTKIDFSKSKLGEIEGVMATASLNYDDWEKTYTNLGLGFADLLVNIAYGTHTFGRNLMGLNANKTVVKDVLSFKDEVEAIKGSYQKTWRQLDPSIESVLNPFNPEFWSEANREWIWQDVAVTQVPIYSMYMLPGGFSYATAFLHGYGDVSSQLDREEIETGKKRSFLNRLAITNAYSATELVLGVLPTKYIMPTWLGGSKNNISKLIWQKFLPKKWKVLGSSGVRARINGNPMYKEQLKMSLKQHLVTAVPNMFVGRYGEAYTERWTQMLQNMYMGRPIMEGADEAFDAGFVMGGGMVDINVASGIALSYYSDVNRWNTFQDKLSEKNELSQRLQNQNLKIELLSKKTKPHTKQQNESIQKAKSDIETIEKTIKDLDAEMGDMIKAEEKKASKVNNKFFGYFQENFENLQNIRLKSQSILENNSMSEEQKNRELTKLKVEFDRAQNYRNLMKDDNAFGDHFKAFKNSANEKDIVRLKEITEKVTEKLKLDGNTNPTETQIDEEVEIEYYIQEINNDYNKNRRTKLARDFNNFQEVEDAIKGFEKLLKNGDITQLQFDNLVKNAENGNDLGATIKLQNGNTYAYQIVRNAAKQGRTKTRVHEQGHQMLIELFGSNSQVEQLVAEQLLAYLNAHDPALALLMQMQVERYEEGDVIPEGYKVGDMKVNEIIPNFLELVADGKIDLKKDSNRGLGRLIGDLFGMGVADASGTKFNFDFEGEEDAVQFIIGLGKKLAASDLKMEDLATMKKNALSKLALITDTKKALKGDGKIQKSTVNLDEGTGDISQKIDRYTNNATTEEDLFKRNPDTGVIPFNNIYNGIVQGKFDRIFGANISQEQKVIQRKKLADRFAGMTEEGGYDPAKTPLLSKWMYGGSGKAGHVVYSGLAAKLDLFKRGEKAKREVRGDEVTETGKTVFEGMVDPSTTQDKTSEKRGPKQRVLTSLSDIDLINNEFIDEKVMKTISDVIDKNSPDLEQQLTNIIEKEFNKVIIEGMGGNIQGNQKDGPIIQEDYEVFVNTQYKNVIESLSDDVIKKNYNKLFDLKKVGKEKKITRKKDKPELKKDSYFEKDIFAKKVNKAKWIKHFTQGGYTTLRARQTALAKLIAEAKAKDVIDNYLNTDISGATRATLEKVSKRLDRQKNQIRSFDSIQYAKKSNVTLDQLVEGKNFGTEIIKKAYNYSLGDLSTEFGIPLTPLMQFQKGDIVELDKTIFQEGTDKVYTSQRDLDAPFPNGKGTYGEVGARIINDFLVAHPEFRDLIRKTMTGGVTGGFFLTDVEFNKVINEVSAKQQTVSRYTYSLTGTKFLNPKLVKALNTDEFAKGQAERLPLLYDFFKAVETYLNTGDNSQNVWIFEEMLKDTGKAMNTFTRILAPISFVPKINGEYVFDQAIVEEHTDPQNQVGKGLLWGALHGEVDIMWKTIGQSYMQGALLEIHDPGGNLAKAMPEEYYQFTVPLLKAGLLDLDPGIASVIRLAISGPENNSNVIDLNIYHLDPMGINKSITEYFGVNTDRKITPEIIKIQNETIVKVLTGKIAQDQATKEFNSRLKLNDIINTKKSEAKIQNSKAINNSRAININTESRGMSAWDFDDTLATTKSGVRATIPNPDGTPQPSRKVIFLAGGAGSGKSNVVSKLGLEDQGFKVVNSDISLEWLKKNSGLPANMNDLTKEQLSELGKLQYKSRQISKGKMMKYQGNAEGVVVDGTGGSINAMTGLVNEFKAKGYDVSMVFVETSLETALERNKAREERSLTDKIVTKNHEAVQGNKDGFKEMFGERFMEVKTDNLTQEDAMPADLTTKMNDFVSGYKKVRLDAEQFATEGADILAQGGEFDFSEFNVVTGGEVGPMFNTAMNRAKKFGTKDTYVLTARPQASAVPIQQFLASQGLNIPLENITGLGNSTGEAKAEWMLGKFSEGYNNMFFADDAMQNVKAVKDVLDQLDIKSKVVQAKIQFSKEMKSTMGEILDGEQLTNIKKQSSINDVKSVERLSSPGVYSNIQFSKKHRAEYENLISKHRPDLVKEGLVSGTVDNMFNYIDNLDVPADKKRKYERITTKWIATSNIKLNEDSYKIKDAVELSEKYKEDIFSYNNPNEIIEKYAGKPKGPIDPNTVEQFRENKSFENKKYGITEYNVLDGTTSEGSYVTEEVKEAQEAVRKVIDTHWGENSNPWCITQKKNGKLTEDSFDNWIEYSDGPKRIVFQNGKLLAFYANDLYWDRMDNDTDAPVVYIKEGRVTKKVELVPVGKNKVDEFVMEVRTVSEDGNTVTTEVVGETDSSYEVGTKIVENRVNGITVKKTRSTADKTSIEWGFEPGSVQEVQNYNKKGELTSSIFYESAGVIGTINYAEQFGGITEAEIVEGKGDIISHEGGGEFFAQINLAKQGIKNADSAVTTEIGWEMDGKLEDVITTSSNGEIRVDLKKILKIDPELQGLPRNIQFSKKIDVDLNQILEESMNVDAKKRFSATQAKLKGGKFKVRGVIPPSAQDFMGLLYNFVGKGKQGDQHLEMLKKALVDPFARGIDQLNTARQNSSEDYRALLKQFPDVKRDLNLKLGKLDGLPDHISDFTIDQAVRVYLWNKSGFDVPGLSARDLKALDSFVKDDSELLAFADGLGIISKKTEGYTKPGEYWLVENIASDLMSDGAIGDARSEFLAEWLENKNIIFSEENLNKIEAIYGSKFREALEDILYAMETGKNRPQGSGRILNMYMNWVNNSVGAIMFFNIRSAVLQTISATNYINWSDNNPLKAAAAFANQKQFWSDFVMLFNSDYLKQRRTGNRRGVNEAELSAAVAGSENKVKAALAWLLKKGFTPTQIADSFAIASGGAAFYRNRVKSLMKEGMSKAEAETQAFLDFQETTEVSQQSARPDMISQQQRNPLGRIILAFANTPMQYGRIMNKAFRDLANGRGDAKTHVSKIVYYGAVQSIIFTALQSALFAVLGSDDDDEKEEMIDKKTTRMLNSMIDTWLTSIGYGGKAISTVKNTIMEYNKQRAKDVDEDFMTKSDHAYTLLQALSFSPPIGSKLRKIYQSIQTEKFNRDIMKERGLTLDNPVWGMIGNVIEGVTNIPLGRISNKMLNLDNALDSRNETWQRIAMLMGWNTWDLGIKDPDLVALGEDIKERKKQEKKMETEKKKFEKKREKLKEKYPGKTDEEIEIAVKSKELFDLSKQDQIDLLKKLEVSDKEIKKLKKEQDRTDKIAELYKENSKLIDDFVKESKNKPKKKKEKKKEVKLSKSEKREKDLFKMNKKDQVNLLLELGYSPRKVNSLKYEKDRVRVIMKLEGKKSK